jgi:hypothetical protein
MGAIRQICRPDLEARLMRVTLRLRLALVWALYSHIDGFGICEKVDKCCKDSQRKARCASGVSSALAKRGHPSQSDRLHHRGELKASCLSFGRHRNSAEPVLMFTGACRSTERVIFSSCDLLQRQSAGPSRSGAMGYSISWSD